MLEEVHKRLPRLADFKVEDWGQRRFGEALGRHFIG
jgi:hypothetical protein